MTVAAALLNRLHDAGATVTLRNGKVTLSAVAALDPGLVAEAKEARDELLALLSLPPAASEQDTSPAYRCAACGFGQWWRLSVLSGGPGPWTCQSCNPPDPTAWLDACAIPAA